eukprot:scaffold387566_cov16-Prasinocladus_malaysianus.AAC.1
MSNSLVLNVSRQELPVRGYLKITHLHPTGRSTQGLWGSLPDRLPWWVDVNANDRPHQRAILSECLTITGPPQPSKEALDVLSIGNREACSLQSSLTLLDGIEVGLCVCLGLASDEM